jgi:cation:H+ antiporter
VLLATATSLPEIATTSAAALAGNAALVLGNLFGGITMQTAILAAADGLLVAGVLTMYPRKPTHALEAILLVILLSVLLAACIFGERELAFGIGAGTMLLGLCYGGSIWLLRRYDANSDWIPLDLPEAVPVANSRPRPRHPDLPLSRLYWRMTGYAALILAGGIVLVTSAEAIAVQSGLGASFVGVTVLAAATSLPEISTTFAAVRLGAYTMAISNIFRLQPDHAGAAAARRHAVPRGHVARRRGPVRVAGADLRPDGHRHLRDRHARPPQAESPGHGARLSPCAGRLRHLACRALRGALTR